MVRLFRHYVPRSILVIGALEGVVLFGTFYLSVMVLSAEQAGVAGPPLLAELGSGDLAAHSPVVLDFTEGIERLGEADAPADGLAASYLLREAGVYTLVMMVLLAAMGLYERGLRDRLPGVWLRVALGFLGGVVLAVGFTALQPEALAGVEAILPAIALSGAGVLLVRTLFYRLADKPSFKRRIMILGVSGLAGELERLRRRSDWQGNLLVGYLPMPGEESCVSPNRVLCKEGVLLEIARRHNIDEIVVALRESSEGFPVAELLDCKMSGIEVNDIATFLERITGKIKLEALTASDMVFADGFVQALQKGLVHRAFDVLVSAAMLVLTLPVMLITAVAIFLESRGRGPIFYKQERVGRNGRLFQILKFRSMEVDAEKVGEPRWADGRDDPRITRVGHLIRRTRIDELPQILNVLKGEMSFVGPRPERPAFVAQLAQAIPYYDLRHCVNPGLTGWAQIRYRYGASEEDAKEKLQYDLYYVKNYSLFLDVTILLQTAQVVLWGKGAR